MTQIAEAPTLTTNRLVLRPHVLGDYDDYGHLMMSERARFMGGPFEPIDAWRNFASDVVQWTLIGGGALAVTLRDAGTVVGQVCLNRIPPFPEPELGWIAYDGHEGHGYVTEAARAFGHWCLTHLNLSSMVSYIDPENARSIAVAERLGAKRDDTAIRPDGESPEECLVYRHPIGGTA